jgi:hexokinase
MAGSMADVPKDLAEEIHKLEKLFTVEPSKLKEITDHFVSELAKGMMRIKEDFEILANIKKVSVLRAVAL